MKKFPKQKTDAEYKKSLTNDQYRVTQKSGTEAPFTSKLLDNKDDGMYKCVRCGAELFESDSKFDSGTGWPSFDRIADGNNVSEREDDSFMMKRTEVYCNRCGSHLGHVFEDGPTDTGKRYCINGVSLDFDKEDNKSPDQN